MKGWQPFPLSSFGLSSDNLGGGTFAVALELMDIIEISANSSCHWALI
jgi:hypothetical protein